MKSYSKWRLRILTDVILFNKEQYTCGEMAGHRKNSLSRQRMAEFGKVNAGEKTDGLNVCRFLVGVVSRKGIDFLPLGRKGGAFPGFAALNCL